MTRNTRNLQTFPSNAFAYFAYFVVEKDLRREFGANSGLTGPIEAVVLP